MNREEAIDILDDNFTVIETHGHYTEEEVEQARQMAITALSQEQQSEWERDHEVLKAYADGQESMKPCWIPVSERLPEEDNCTGSGVQFSDDVLMSVLNIVDEEDFIDFGHTIDGEWYSIVEKKRIQNGFDVIAWMPLPRPYKGESECEK